ncbi:pca operon transcription factor PcaQ [Paraburkholderia caribensis]|jgi:LysR family pca operon transcriptional activator|uniref:pca operon transcription factor PcaQ n=1 Tax=Paraburkholderia caribensis TaxID=75105 RepID=UPI0006D46A92|nr:pca operon transcription factor PcaQ [Paraburkholderia caribensis]ALP65608.1 LysR family transcriptional regulator [Paraburkholderia caribensis]AMV46483.1 LysR family transcriptional regulator [Paraburkholderia caribensis]AUT55469.1 pca operon transcription factor PcaQ [Paraburkholderia caribensis]CAG9232214.1 LysR family transcriptional regulator [Paraburkholderia caribensis]
MQRSLADSRVKFRHLQCFLAVAQFGGVQKAAQSLSITQPAVSKTVAELEEILGVRLFERGRHGAVPTREGQLFMPHASACVSALRQGVDLLARVEGEAAATLDIGVLPTVATSLVPPVMRLFGEQWPNAIVRLKTGSNTELLERLKAGAIEFAVGRLADPERMVGLTFEQLYSEPLVAVVRAGHALASGPLSSATRLLEFSVVVPPYGTLIRQSAESLLRAWAVPPLSSFVEVLSVSVGRALALENDAVWFVPRSAIEYELAHGLLVPLPLPIAGTEEPVGLILRSDTQPTPVGRALIDAVRKVARERLARHVQARAEDGRGKRPAKGRTKRDAGNDVKVDAGVDAGVDVTRDASQGLTPRATKPRGDKASGTSRRKVRL